MAAKGTATDDRTGVLLLAIAHPNYAALALNLRYSLRLAAPELPVAVVVDKHTCHRLQPFAEHFAALIPLEAERIAVNGELRPFWAKTMLYGLTPFTRTLYLDADTLLFPPQAGNASLQNQLNDLRGTAFQPMCTGQPTAADQLWGASVQELRKLWQLKSSQLLYEFNSSWLYWEQGEWARRIFNQAESAYRTPRASHTVFAGAVPDELAFSIAAARENWQPTRFPYTPLANWSGPEGREPLAELQQRYVGVTFLGARLSVPWQQVYNRMAVQAHYAARSPYPFKWVDKRLWAAHRREL